MSNIEILFIDEMELHRIGDYTAVVWETTEEIIIQGNTTITRHVRTDYEPYIRLVKIGYWKEKPYLDDGNPTTGGMSPEFADLISDELHLAAEYLRENI